jgi:hypothetical protein
MRTEQEHLRVVRELVHNGEVTSPVPVEVS